MYRVFCIFVFNVYFLSQAHTDDEEYEDNNIVNSDETKVVEPDFEPSIPTSIIEENSLLLIRVLKCDDFQSYSRNCSKNESLLYNGSKNVPPLSSDIFWWCKALRLRIDCAVDWNKECGELTTDLFNEHIINGRSYVFNHTCQNHQFIRNYDNATDCIKNASSAWETCYTSFKAKVEDLANNTLEWTHYTTHFYLCCARAKFRRCTFNALFEKCSPEQAVTVQKFAVIVSEGDILQDCELSVMYAKCPGGDPRPSRQVLSALQSSDTANEANVETSKLCITLFKMLIFYILAEYICL